MSLATDIATMIARGIVKLVNTTTGCQTLQLEVLGEDATDPDVEDFQPFGVSFRRPVDDEALVFGVGGDANHLVAVGSSGRGHRPTTEIESGEGGLYYAGEWKVFLKADGNVYLGAVEGAEPVALASQVEAELEKIRSALNSVAGGAGAGGSELTGANTYAAVGSVGAEKTLAK